MHVLFVHKNFPAQFGQIARHLIRFKGWRCSFISETPTGVVDGIKKIRYQAAGGATLANHYCTRGFENGIWNAQAVFDACQRHPELKPDLIVGHSGFGSTLFLPEWAPEIPIINYFEYYYHPHDSDLDFRKEFPVDPMDFLRAKSRNAMILLDLVNCRKGYSPTKFQKGLFPAEFQSKIEVIFDGIDTDFYHHRAGVRRRVGGVEIPASTRIVTYISRGFESLRGFDIFMRAAKRIYERFPEVLFVAVGSDRVAYGGDHKYIKHKSFKEHVMEQDKYDPSKFLFTGSIPARDLVDVLSLSDLHIYLTAPFVLSWSLMNALACGCTVLASDTAPVREMIVQGHNGLLVDFFDVEGIASAAVDVLKAPALFRHLGEEGERMIHDQYSLDKIIPKLTALFEGVVDLAGSRGGIQA